MQRISELLIKRLSVRLSPAEEAELKAWRDECEENRRLYDRLTDPASLKKSLDLWHMVDTARPCRDMQNHVNLILRRRRIRSYVSIAAAFAAVVVGIAMFLRSDFSLDSSKVGLASGRHQAVTAIDDIKPGVVCATLSDEQGNNIVLQAADTASTANVTAILLDNAPVTTSVTDTVARELCLDVPRGGEFKVQLEDGTEVWLNSASRLYYPATFSGDTRRVRIEGEAYLSVAADSLRPFLVETDNQLVRVYGTAFNIRNYPEEQGVYTTLEHGKVSLRRADDIGGELFLTPGHQAVFNTSDYLVNVRQVNTDVVTSWRKGRFVFEHQTLLRIMQDLSRWYDFDYEFADESLKREEFMGSIPRYSDFTTAISILEKCGGIRFAVADGKVLVGRSE